MTKHKRNIILSITIIGIISLIIWLVCPMSLFHEPQAYILYDNNGILLDATIADDGQWRLPQSSDYITPKKYKTCLLNFEDKRFEKHNGVDWISVLRASLQNIKAKSVVSGGSTISMQVIRLSKKGQRRTIKEKIKEIILAYKLEIKYSKNEILGFYTANAPYGGNIVGIKAASWRYFGRDADELTWAESALLAVLPNAPSSIHMNKNREMLKSKRDRLLHKLLVENVIDKMEYELAMEEEIPEELRGFPHSATHLLMRLKKKHPSTHEFVTNLNFDIQKSTFEIADRHYKELRKNGINNVAIIVAETESGKVKAYIGNTGIFDKNGESAFVDIPSSSRSTGSILKPFLYSNMLSRGEILPNSLVPDIPTRFGNFSPENYNLEYEGAVPSSRAIARSLNVPAVHMLKTHGIDVFLNDLHELGIKSINRSASDYGLSLILGGAEARLDELTAAYASMGRRLIHYQTFNGKYFESDVHQLSFLPRDTFPISTQLNEAQLSAAGIWHCFEAMKTLKRPNNQGNWEYFNSDQAIAWKTGTSYGFRDAWAIGVTPDYVVGVWVGNADGEGRPGLIGLMAAAPILFDVFENLPSYKQWFSEPWDDMVKMPICKESGYIASENCNNIDSVWIPKAGSNFKQCPYHKLYHLDSTGEFQVNASCYSTSEMKHISRFVLPPVMEWYYKQSHPWYKGLPPTSPNCTFSQNKIMQFIYPDDNMKIYLPIDLNGIKQKVLFEAAHQNSNAQIFWHIDEEYITTTQGHHQISVLPKVGKHNLTILDAEGNKLTHRFEIISERE